MASGMMRAEELLAHPARRARRGNRRHADQDRDLDARLARAARRSARTTPVSMQNCVCTKSAPAATLARRPFGLPVRRRIDRHVGRAEDEVELARRSRCPDGSLSLRAHAMRPSRAARCCRDRTPAWRRAGRPPSDRRRASTSMLRMPSAAAPRRSPCSASRLRSRQVIWKIGSMPLCTRKCAAARLERCTLAPAPSVTFTAVASALERQRAAQELGRIGGHRRRDLGGDDELAAAQPRLEVAAFQLDLSIGIRPT